MFLPLPLVGIIFYGIDAAQSFRTSNTEQVDLMALSVNVPTRTRNDGQPVQKDSPLPKSPPPEKKPSDKPSHQSKRARAGRRGQRRVSSDRQQDHHKLSRKLSRQQHKSGQRRKGSSSQGSDETLHGPRPSRQRRLSPARELEGSRTRVPPPPPPPPPPRIGASNSKDDDTTLRAPIAVAMTGGGLRAMFGAATVARALALHNLWPKVTHLSTVSGSSWFSLAFVYSEHVYGGIHDEKIFREIFDICVDWKKRYKEKADNKDFEVIAEMWGALDIRHVAEHVKGVGNMFSLQSPWEIRWKDFVVQLLQGFFGKNKNSLLHKEMSSKRAGISSLTLLNGVSLPPDAWLRPLSSSTLKFDGSSTFPMPACYVSAGPVTEHSGWLYNDTVQLKVNEDRLVMPKNPEVITIAAATSAFFGFLSSPTMTKQYFEHVPNVTRNVLAGLYSNAQIGIMRGMAAPLKSQNATVYRAIDGGYTENTGAPFALAQMQKDCELRPPRMNCSVKKRMLIVSHKQKGTEGLINLFSRKDLEAGELSYDAGARASWEVPYQAIFKEHFEHVKWKTWNGVTYWHGDLETVRNRWFAVRGGETINVLLVNINAEDQPSFLSPMRDSHICAKYTLSARSFRAARPGQVERELLGPIFNNFMSKDSSELWFEKRKTDYASVTPDLHGCYYRHSGISTRCGGPFNKWKYHLTALGMPHESSASQKCCEEQKAPYDKRCGTDSEWFFKPVSQEVKGRLLPGCYYKQPTARSSCGGEILAWHPDIFGREFQASWKDAASCHGRKFSHDAFCRSESEWMFISEDDAADLTPIEHMAPKESGTGNPMQVLASYHLNLLHHGQNRLNAAIS